MRSAKGSITKLGYNHYRVRVEGAPDPTTGKRRQVSKTVRGTRKQAEELKAKLLVEAGDDIIDSSTPLGEFFELSYVPEKERLIKQGKFKRRTLSAYEDRMRLHVLPTFGDTPLKDITILRIKQWLDGFDKPTVALEAFKTLRSVLTFAVKDLKLRSNPCLKVEEPEVAAYEPRVLDVDEINAYMETYRGSTVEAAVLLAIGGGFRRGEICALNVEDIDFATGDVFIDDAYITDRGDAFGEDTKNRKSRIVAIPAIILERLREILPECGPVLPGRDSERMYPGAVTRSYTRRQKDLPDGVPRIPLKDLRHSSLTLAYDTGAEDSAVQDRGSHGSFKTTRRYYLRPHRDRDRKIAEAMNERLAGSRRKVIVFEVFEDEFEEF